MSIVEKIVGLLGVFITLPIWFYLLHEILEAVNATDLMWFLYWAYVPITLFMSALQQVAKGK